jgi:hypothetical protein
MVYRKITHTAQMVTGYFNPLDQWISFDTLFVRNTPVFPVMNYLQMGPLVTAALGVALLGLAVNPRRGWRAFAWFGLCATLVLLVLPQGNAFWSPHGVPLASFIQFPWRLLGPVALVASVVVAVGASAFLERASDATRRGIAILGAAALLFLVAWPSAAATEMSIGSIPVDAASIRQGMISTAGVDEYLPIEAAKPATTPPRHLVSKTDGATVEYASSLGSHHLLTLQAGRDDASVGLALYGFPSWTVKTLSGPQGAEVKLDMDEQGLLRLRLPAPGQYKLLLWFGTSPAGVVGEILSLLTLLALVLVLVHSFRPWPWRLPVRAPSGERS